MRLARPAFALSHPLAMAGVYTLISLLLTWPLLLHFGDALPAGGDAWQNVWNLWWLRKAIESGQWPFHTGYKYYPYGVNLYFDTMVPLAGLLGTPLQWLGLNLLSTYNVMVLLSFVLAALGMYLLARYLTGDALASFIAGFIFGFCPYHFAHLYGHLNLMWMQWLPYYILFLLKAVDGAIGQGEPLFAPTNVPSPKGGGKEGEPSHQGEPLFAPTENDATAQQGGINPVPTPSDQGGPPPASTPSHQGEQRLAPTPSDQGGPPPASTPSDQGEQRFAPTEDAAPARQGGINPASTGDGTPPLQQSTIYNLQSTIHNALLAGFFLVLTAYSEWTYVAFLTLFTIFYLLYRLWGVRRGGWRQMTRL
ncbi:MAG: hypothetical protein DLM69_03300, partial [Candidatus Chloroheliales bacterium]